MTQSKESPYEAARRALVEWCVAQKEVDSLRSQFVSVETLTPGVSITPPERVFDIEELLAAETKADEACKRYREALERLMRGG